MNDNKKEQKWAKELSSSCGINQSTLQSALEELSESCHGDSATSKKVIEELTLSCHFNEEDMRIFIRDVSRNCPVDVKKLQEEVHSAQGRKDEAYKAINRTIKPLL